MSESSFCDGYDESSCPSCPSHDTQHPCWFEKVKYMRDNGVHLGRAATPSRTRLKGDPQHIKNPRTSFDHAIPTDERGVPFLGGNLDPLTQKEIGNLGGNFEKKRKELAAGQAHSNTVNHM